jgi:hypothetical protein
MAQPIDYLIYLRKKNGVNYDYYSIESGVFTTTTSATPVKPIQFAPTQWDEIQLSYSRTLDTKGVFRSLSDSYKFVRDGAKILRKLFFEGGVNAKCEVLIRKFNRAVGVYAYEDYFLASADFTTATNETSYFTINLKEAGFLSKYESRKSTKYKIPITDNANAVWVYYDGINLQGIFNWVAVGAGAKDPTNNFDLFFLFSALSLEGINISTYLNSVVAPITTNKSVLRNFTSSAINYRIQLSGDAIMQRTILSTVYYHLIFRLRDSAGVLIPTNIAANTLEVSAGFFTTSQVVFPFDIDQVVSVPAGHYLDIVIIGRDGIAPAGGELPNSNISMLDGTSKLIISWDNRTKPTYVPHLTRDYVFKELVKLIGDNTTTGAGTFLTSSACNDKLMTSGDALRNLPKAQMYISMDDFFETIDSQHGAGLHYKQSTDEFFLYNYTSLFPSIEIANLGEVGKINVKPVSNEFYSKLKVGQQDYTFDQVNGKDEFNTEIEMLSPLEGVKGSKSYLSPVRHDIYGIEQIRLNLSEKKVTDAESDNDVFEIHANISVILSPIPAGNQGEGNQYHILYRDLSLTITNMYSPSTLYNIYFSPRRALIRRGSWERSLLFGNDTGYIKFINSKKSNELNLYMTTFDGVTTINEGSDVLISTLGSPIFKPYILQVEVVTALNLVSLLNTSPFGYLTILDKGLTYRGYILDLTRQSDALNKTKIDLLVTADTDITQLIV